jgi:hypothetical protein
LSNSRIKNNEIYKDDLGTRYQGIPKEIFIPKSNKDN